MACLFLPLPARIVEWGMRWLPHSGACPGACAGSRPPRSHRGVGHALAPAFWDMPRGMRLLLPLPRSHRGVGHALAPAFWGMPWDMRLFLLLRAPNVEWGMRVINAVYCSKLIIASNTNNFMSA